MRAVIVLAVGLAALALTGCSTKNAIEWYDECEASTSSFAAMIACGKQKRLAACKPIDDCTTEGDSVVAYGDSLVQSVNDRSLSEAEAKRQWIEFKLSRGDEYSRRAARTRSRAPVTCNTIGGTTTCF